MQSTTFAVADKPVTKYKREVYSSPREVWEHYVNNVPVIDPYLLEHLPEKYRQPSPALKILQTNLPNDDEKTQSAYAYTCDTNGFVNAICCAYSNHHKLILRADDFWIAILTQFSFYFQKRAEQFRSKMVNFDGKKQLEILFEGKLDTIFESLLLRMGEKILQNIKDPNLLAAFLPEFSTTTKQDKVVASAIMMATAQKYFDFVCQEMCGVPEVTLLGTVEDYQKLHVKIEWLRQFDDENKYMTKWIEMLSYITSNLILSKQGKPDPTFWGLICSSDYQGSGSRYLTGWLATFCVFNDDGKWRGGKGQVSQTSGQYFAKIDYSCIPTGIVQVPITVQCLTETLKAKCYAGSMMYEVQNDATTLKPSIDFCIAAEKTDVPNPL